MMSGSEMMESEAVYTRCQRSRCVAMNVQKRIRLTPHEREEIWRLHGTGNWTKAALAKHFHVSRQTIYKVLARARCQEFAPRKSTNKRFLGLKYGIKRLEKIERSLEERKKREARRCNGVYPGKQMRFDTRRLPIIRDENAPRPREYLFVAIDDFSRELYAAILPDKTQHSAAAFLQQVIEECPYTIEYAYSDGGAGYRGSESHAFVKLCNQYGIGHKCTRASQSQTNSEAESVIRTIMEMWRDTGCFENRQDRKTSLARFINFYNTVKPHKGINNQTPYKLLSNYFFKHKVF